MDNQKKTTGSVGSGPDRHSYWQELDDSGKVERLRQVIKEQETIIVKMANYLSQLIVHEHMDGKMVQPISHPNAESYGGFHYRKKDDWF